MTGETSSNWITYHNDIKIETYQLMSVTFVKFELIYFFRDALSGVRWFLAAESFLKIIKNSFCFTIKVDSVLKIFKFLFWISWPCKKADWQESYKVNFKLYYVTSWKADNYDIFIAQYFKNKRQSDSETGSVNRI